MELPDLKSLAKVIDLCRKKGVSKFTVGGISFELGHEPIEPARARQAAEKPEADPANPYANFPAGELTPEQLAFYSAGGVPEDDPFLKEALADESQ